MQKKLNRYIFNLLWCLWTHFMIKYSSSKKHRSPCYIFHITSLLFIKTSQLTTLNLQSSNRYKNGISDNWEHSRNLQEIIAWNLIIICYIKAVDLLFNLAKLVWWSNMKKLYCGWYSCLVSVNCHEFELGHNTVRKFVKKKID